MDIVYEEWRDVIGYEGLYKVSNLGRVKSLERIVTDRNGVEMPFPSVMKKNTKSKTGYWHVNLWKDNKVKFKKVHRLIAEVFIPNPENKPQINHIDSNRLNNEISNLEWCTASENTIHAVRLGRIKSPMVGTKGLYHSNNKPVIQLSKDGEPIKEFISQMAASIELGISHSKISLCANGKRETTGGYKWKYKKDNE